MRFPSFQHNIRYSHFSPRYQLVHRKITFIVNFNENFVDTWKFRLQLREFLVTFYSYPLEAACGKLGSILAFFPRLDRLEKAWISKPFTTLMFTYFASRRYNVQLLLERKDPFASIRSSSLILLEQQWYLIFQQCLPGNKDKEFSSSLRAERSCLRHSLNLPPDQ